MSKNLKNPKIMHIYSEFISTQQFKEHILVDELENINERRSL